MKTVLVLAFLFLIGTENRAQPAPAPIPVHDPVMIRQDSTYYAFATGRGIAIWSSNDRVNWKREKPVFEQAPDWAVKAVPTFKNHIWAPDISFHNGRYYLFYSVSAFGKNTSCIGLATNKTLHPNDPNYRWTDHGLIVQSVPGRDNWNAIDPNLLVDETGKPWLAFGSFWDGIKLVRLRDDLSALADAPPEWHTLASRQRSAGANGPANDGAIEAPFLFRKGGFYYLFVSFDLCCKGPKSTYKVMVGRSEKITGPYLDQDGKKMVFGGGTLVVEGNASWHGVGHNAVGTFDGTDYLIFHGYDAADNGKSKLLIRPLEWDASGWPKAKL
ncbi:arabinan endo-1,5-alpha-L-arabinosidase [Larkinella ripae]